MRFVARGIPFQNDQMPPPPGIFEGFVLKVFAADHVTKVFVNVCGHPSVGLPLTRSMDPIPNADFLDTFGLDNLIVPISVGDPKHCKKTSELDSGKMIIVDVVIHPEVVRRVNPSHRLFQDFLTRVTALALDWVTQETGIQLNKKTVKMLPNCSYKDAPTKGTANDKLNAMDNMDPAERKALEESVRKRANDLYEQLLKETSKGTATEAGTAKAYQTDSSVKLPESFQLNGGDSKADPPTKKKMVTEMPTNEPLLRKGFLDNPKARLYGEGGTTEGVLPEGAGDPLGYMPKSLRDKCKIIDARQEAKPQPQKKQLPFTVGKDEEVSGEEFLSQLSALDSLMSSGDKSSISKFAADLVKGVDSKEERAPTALASTSSSEVSNNGESAPPLQASSAHHEKKSLLWEATISSEGASVVVRFSAPPTVMSMKDIDLGIEETIIEVNGEVTPIKDADGRLIRIDVESVVAKFVKSSRTLIITAAKL